MLDNDHHGTSGVVMASELMSIEIKGWEKIQKALKKFPGKIEKYLGQAGHEVANRVILPEKGLQTYPPETDANRPPVPYYIRGVGMETEKGNYHNSENLGKQWYTERDGLDIQIGNRASYAKWVHGDDDQRANMARIGWKKLYKTAKEKVGGIKKVYNAWVAKAIKDLGL